MAFAVFAIVHIRSHKSYIVCDIFTWNILFVSYCWYRWWSTALIPEISTWLYDRGIFSCRLILWLVAWRSGLKRLIHFIKNILRLWRCKHCLYPLSSVSFFMCSIFFHFPTIVLLSVRPLGTFLGCWIILLCLAIVQTWKTP